MSFQESELKLGSISEIWKYPNEWLAFCNFLDNMGHPSGSGEGLDSDNRPMKMSRYALFLKLYVDLHQLEQNNAQQSELKNLVLQIGEHEEDFFGLERCLRCLDAGQRKEILENVKKVRKNQAPAGAWVFASAYSPVLDKLNVLCGSYNEQRLVHEAKQLEN